MSKIILLVDDDETSIFINQRILNKLGIEVEVLTARNGQEALDIMKELCGQEQCPALILLDINMPVMNGFEFLEQLQNVADSHSSSLKIVLLSSSTHHLDKAKAKNFPVMDYIQKPLTKEKLLKFYSVNF